MLLKPGAPSAPSPTDMRPISVVSHVYRLWSRTRFQDCTPWHLSWIHNKAFGGVPGRNAEQLGLELALSMEEHSARDMICGGLSYDFKTAFDLIPYRIMITSLQKRGAPPQLLQSLTGVYQQLTRTYRLHGFFSQWWKASNGITQGCSLSLIGLNSLICCILEKAYNLPTPQLNDSPISCAYADDVSADCAAKTPSRLVNKLKDFHAIVQKYETCGIGEINKKKTFTFGHYSLQGAIEPSFEHQNDIRMVGVSIVTDHPCDSFTELEQSRFRKWGDTIIKIRRLPISWKDKTRTLLSTQSQATFGQGAHQMCKDLSLLKKLRTSIMCCLWQADFYSMSPLVTLSVLAPVHLDPHFALIYYGLQSLQRFFKSNPSVLVKIKQILTRPRSSTIGPAARLADLLHSPVKSQVQQLLDNNITNVGKWKHDMREAWRQHMFSQLEHDRPQHYSNITQIDRRRTLLYHTKLEPIANGSVDAIIDTEDSYMQLALLRRLIAGGMMTQERDKRHRRQHNIENCQCGLEEAETVEHVSWSCLYYKHIRDPLLKMLKKRKHQLPAITQYAAIILQNSPLTDDEVLQLQQVLIQIWQQHIQRFYSEDLNEDPPSKPPEASPDDNILRNSNGHALALKDNGGMWCRKCGKHVSNLKHIRLKITKSKCLFEHKTPAEYLSQPGLMTSEHRLDLAFEELVTKYNAGGHVLSWNRKLGKQDGPNLGIIKCSQCGREWKWKDRCNNLKRTKCIPSAPSTSHSSAASSSIKHSAPLRRISGKQPDPKISSALTQRTGIG